MGSENGKQKISKLIKTSDKIVVPRICLSPSLSALKTFTVTLKHLLSASVKKSWSWRSSCIDTRCYDMWCENKWKACCINHWVVHSLHSSHSSHSCSLSQMELWPHHIAPALLLWPWICWHPSCATDVCWQCGGTQPWRTPEPLGTRWDQNAVAKCCKNVAKCCIFINFLYTARARRVLMFCVPIAGKQHPNFSWASRCSQTWKPEPYLHDPRIWFTAFKSFLNCSWFCHLQFSSAPLNLDGAYHSQNKAVRRALVYLPAFIWLRWTFKQLFFPFRTTTSQGTAIDKGFDTKNQSSPPAIQVSIFHI